MITLTFSVDDINTVIQVYDQIQVQRSSSETGTYTTVSGLGPVSLSAGQTTYELLDTTGVSSDWYRSRYYSSSTGSASAWSDPVLGSPGDLFYNPLYPVEVSYGTSELLVIDRIRRLIGDPVGLYRDFGDDALSRLHFDNKTYELDEKGWPVSITMNNTQYNTSNNPTVNGYRYLRFNSDISDTTTISGVEYGVDIWYYTFRHSNREIMEAYDNSFTPPGLTPDITPATVYMIQTAIDLLHSELWEDSAEDGAKITDDETSYDPSPGLDSRRRLLDGLRKRLDDLIKQYKFTGIEGVLID